MSRLVAPPVVPRKLPAEDPFAIGWRDVCRTLSDGLIVWEQIPLTLEDALHPHEDDKIMANTVHNRDWLYLRDVIQSRICGDPTALVTCDVKVLWEDGIHHSPDIAVYAGICEPGKFRGQIDVVAEGQRPRLIVEVVSPNTRPNDVVSKVKQYHRYRVPLFVVIDREDEDSLPQLIAYEFTPRRFRVVPLEDDGRLWLAPVNMWLGVRDNRVVAFDGDTDAELGDYVAVSAALAEEQARADAAEARAAAANQRAEAAEARIRELERVLNGNAPRNGQ